MLAADAAALGGVVVCAAEGLLLCCVYADSSMLHSVMTGEAGCICWYLQISNKRVCASVC